MELHDVCDSLVHETEGVQACVILDVETSLTLTQSRQAGIGVSTIRQAARAAGDIFRGKLLRQFTKTLPSPRRVEDFVREAQMSTPSGHFFMSTVPRLPNAVLVCITEKSVSIGFGWMAVHQAVGRLAEVQGETHRRTPDSGSARNTQGEARSPQSSQRAAASEIPLPDDPASRPPETGVAEEIERPKRTPIRSAPLTTRTPPTVTARVAPSARRPEPSGAAPISPGSSETATGPVEESREADSGRPDVGKLSARGFFAPKPRKGDKN